MKKIWMSLVVLLVFGVSTSCSDHSVRADKKTQSTKSASEEKKETAAIPKENRRTIYLAGGCFWGVEAYFQRIPGVFDTQVGYANGSSTDTSYEKIAKTDHAETVKIDYDISKVSLEEILLHYFRIIDPTSVNKQGYDEGRQYRTGIYYTDEKQKAIIDKMMAYQEKKHGKLAVEEAPLKNYVSAEEYHQNYLIHNPNGSCHIDLNKANDPLVDEDYPLPTKESLKQKLDKESYEIIVNSGTEAPYSSPLNEEYRKGIYVDKVTGEPLFASQDKFNSSCGWPSFSKPILTGKIAEKEDHTYGMNRTEVRSSNSDAHLGHVFTDGPKDKGGLRYCINGASLEFVPYEQMKEKGYEKYMVLVE